MEEGSAYTSAGVLSVRTVDVLRSLHLGRERRFVVLRNRSGFRNTTRTALLGVRQTSPTCLHKLKHANTDGVYGVDRRSRLRRDAGGPISSFVSPR
jgi:hypothetical protein